jgi:GNAT superfamily N-acetyltransferase
MSMAAVLERATIDVTDHPSSEDVMALYHALAAETVPVIGPPRLETVAMFLRDETGAITGGLWGTTLHCWLAINLLLVPASHRGQGLGTRLVRMAEQTARERGCIGAQVSAFDFQAAGFYQRLGFTVFGVQDDNPPGHRSLYLSKRL